MAITIRYKTFTKSRMIEMALPKFNSNTFRAAALSGLMFVTPAFAAEQDCEGCHREAAFHDSIYDAGVLSRNYARQENAIGMVITYGPYEGAPSPVDVGEKFKEEIAKLGERSSYYIVQIDKPGYSIAFDNPYTGTEAMGLSEAARTLKDIVAEKKRLEGYVALGPTSEIK